MKIGTEVAHVTRDSDNTFRVKGQGHQAALVDSSSYYMTYIDNLSVSFTLYFHLTIISSSVDDCGWLLVLASCARGDTICHHPSRPP